MRGRMRITGGSAVAAHPRRALWEIVPDTV
jgi:hypothetical protein